ncbi:MAG: hypothetical protein LBJ31_06620 [Treponema sp.]|nr:hypothetical protein [Treponema sp.]
MSYHEKRFRLRDGYRLLSEEQRSEILGMAEALYFCQIDEKIARAKRKIPSAFAKRRRRPRSAGFIR